MKNMYPTSSTRVDARNVLTYVILSLYCVLILVPITWVILNSFKVKLDMLDYGRMFAFRPTMENYITLFRMRDFGRLLLNSVIVTVATTAITVPVGFAAAYSIVRWPFRGKEGISLAILGTRMLPPVALTLPIYIMFISLRLLNRLWGLIIVYVAFGLPLTIWIIKGYLESLPKAYEESAQIDGCSLTGALFRIILPMCAPGVTSAALLCALNAWSEFLFAMILSSDHMTQTAPVGTAGLISALGIEWGPLLAASTLLTLPMIVLVICAQRNLVEGLVSGLK